MPSRRKRNLSWTPYDAESNAFTYMELGDIVSGQVMDESRAEFRKAWYGDLLASKD